MSRVWCVHHAVEQRGNCTAEPALLSASLFSSICRCPSALLHQESTAGIVCVTAHTGAVLRISVNEATLVPFVLSTLKDSAIAVQLATRLNPSGADEQIIHEFNRLLASGDETRAARLAAESPNGGSWISI